MLVGLKTPRSAASVSALLLECHERIRKFIGLACRLGGASDLPAEHVAEAARDVRRYFEEALPLHAQDEEQSILPRLKGRNEALDRWLEAMTAEHRTHAPLIEALCATCGVLQAAPETLEDNRDKLVATSTALQHEFAVHLQQEEEYIIPAIDRWISAQAQAEVLDEIRARRAGAPRGIP